MRNIICPVSTERVNENVVRLTALQVVLLLGVFLIIPNPFIPVFLLIDFYIRGFTRAKSSPISWISKKAVKLFRIKTVQIDKAPKIFASRVGFLFSFAIAAFFMANLMIPALILTAILMVFAFLECGVNFCAGCWIYTYIILPVYKDK